MKEETNSLPTWDEWIDARWGNKALYTFREVSEIIGCSDSSLYVMVGNCKFEVRRVASSPRITRLSLLAYLQGLPVRYERPKEPEQGSLF